MTSSRRAWFRRLATILLVGSVRRCTTTADEPLASTTRRMTAAGVGWSGDTDASGLVTSPNPPPPKVLASDSTMPVRAPPTLHLAPRTLAPHVSPRHNRAAVLSRTAHLF